MSAISLQRDLIIHERIHLKRIFKFRFLHRIQVITETLNKYYFIQACNLNFLILSAKFKAVLLYSHPSFHARVVIHFKSPELLSLVIPNVEQTRLPRSPREPYEKWMPRKFFNFKGSFMDSFQNIIMPNFSLPFGFHGIKIKKNCSIHNPTLTFVTLQVAQIPTINHFLEERKKHCTSTNYSFVPLAMTVK